MTWMRWECVVVVLAGLALSVPGASAGFPNKPIELIVAFGEGGGTDQAARLIAPFIAKHLGDGAEVNVVNIPGAAGAHGFAALAKAAPDGHTIGFINAPAVVTIPIERMAGFDLDHLDPLVNIVDDPCVWVVRDDSPIRTLADAVEAAKARPRGVSVGTTGLASDDHLVLLSVQRTTGTSFVHVPFADGTANHKSLLIRRIAIAGENLGEAVRYGFVDSLRVLGIMSDKRWDVAADIPTFREQGVDVVGGSMRGVAAPKGLPPEVRARLVDALLRAAKDPEFMAKAATPATYTPLHVLPPDEFAAELRRMDGEYRALWKETPWVK